MTSISRRSGFAARIVSLLVLAAIAASPGSGQESDPSMPASSLDVGDLFDGDSQRQFEQSLGEADRQRMIRLQSRFILADASLPLPANHPAVFYATTTGDIPNDLVAQLQAIGVERVGYAFPRTHMLRTSPDTDADALRAVLQDANVLGTQTRIAADATNGEFWQILQGAGPTQRLDVRIRFWRGTDEATAQQLVAEMNASELVAFCMDDGFADLQLDAAAALALLAHPAVNYVESRPVIDTFNHDSIALANADGIATQAPYNLDGSGETVGVWDSGDAVHTDYNDRVTVMNGAGAHYHGTHVMGTILGSGAGNASAKGFAPAATGFSYYYGLNPTGARRLLRHTDLHTVDNHSYGASSGWGGYLSVCTTYDDDNRDLLMIMCKACGNSGSGSTTIPGDSGFKNGFVIGSTSDGGTISSFSSRGPANDGRLQPNICANGSALVSTYSNNGYGALSGTSMACPSMTGAVTLLGQMWKRHNQVVGGGMPFAPDAAMAVVALTAWDRGNAGPDYQYGFGVVDVRAAADVIKADGDSNGQHIIRGVARTGSVDEFTFDVTTPGKLEVAMAYLDAGGTNGAGVALVNNLDLELEAPNGTTYYPWRGLTTSGGSQTHQFTRDGANSRDNIELVTVDNAAAGRWTARVTATSLETAGTAVGYVLAGDLPFDVNRARYGDPLNGGAPVSIPDSGNGSLVRTISVGAGETIRNLRLHVVLTHTRRGDIRITLESPAGTVLTLEDFEGSPSTRDDVIAIFPDTRKLEDDITSIIGESSGGSWTVTISDHHPGETGSLHFLALDLEFDPTLGPLNQAPNATANSYAVDFDLAASLDASGSTDPDGDALTFQWTQTGGPSVALTGADTANPTFTTPIGPAAVTLAFQVTVSDGRGGIDTATATVDVFAGGGPGPGVGGGGGNGGGSTSSGGGGGCSLGSAPDPSVALLLLTLLSLLAVIRRAT